jgi:large subunit ribosomal protein L13
MAYKQTGGIARIKNVVTDGLRYRLADARGEVLGRFAACVSRVLQGKDKPTYEPHRAEGDVVVVTNAKDIVLTGRKLEDKKYYRHTGYVGNLVTRTAKEMMEREPTFLIRKAVERMLPKNKLRKDMMRKLRVFPGETRVRRRPARAAEDAAEGDQSAEGPAAHDAGGVHPVEPGRVREERRVGDEEQRRARGARGEKSRGGGVETGSRDDEPAPRARDGALESGAMIN